MSVQIPREAVEAAARQIHTGFDRAAPIEQFNAREAAAAALNAAAPVLVATELESLAESVRRQCGVDNEDDDEDYECGYTDALRQILGHAKALRGGE